ncbi:hypothetical protein [Nonomuraea endophytica]|uniref:Uncharacterized protein n=1 Tax=Nonomuraea endophytica TaxID=714136 RepID=A0A7W8AHL1_9ACTN|nr:hypothetical protein [Nonomuraea endophytica]MBB5085251.1 hypothetical protein [Nonomuraea endophytica]
MSELGVAAIGAAAVLLVGLIAAFATIRGAHIQRDGALKQAEVARQQAEVARQQLDDAQRIALEQTINARRAQHREVWSAFLIAADRSRNAAHQLMDAAYGPREEVATLRDQYLQAMAGLHDALAVGEVEGPAAVSEHADAIKHLLNFTPVIRERIEVGSTLDMRPGPNEHPGKMADRVGDLYVQARRTFIAAAREDLDLPDSDSQGNSL